MKKPSSHPMIRGKDQPTLLEPDTAGPFAGFGASAFQTVGEVPTGYAIRTRDSSNLKAAVRTEAPRTPGVYGMLGSRGQVIYIGKAKDLRARLLSYFRPDSSHPKALKILRQTWTLTWENRPDEFQALLRELELIRRFRPRYNVLGQPGRKRYVYLCVGRSPAPLAYLTRDPNGKELAAYGPFVGRGRSIDAVRRLNLEFGLRDCASTTAMNFAEQGELFELDRTAKCLRYELGTCLGPCAGYCTAGEYAERVKMVRAFLEGRESSVTDSLKARIEEASIAQRYEQAAVLRDRLQSLEWLSEKLKFLRTARAKNSFALPLVGADGRMRWYLIHGGIVRKVVFVPHDAISAALALEQLEAVFGGDLPSMRPEERCVDSVLIVMSWFRHHGDARTHSLTGRQAMNVCKALLS